MKPSRSELSNWINKREWEKQLHLDFVKSFLRKEKDKLIRKDLKKRVQESERAMEVIQEVKKLIEKYES